LSDKGISAAVIKRLPRYYRYLDELLEKDVVRISSKELSQKMNVTASQIRQDLNHFGGFGLLNLLMIYRSVLPAVLRTELCLTKYNPGYIIFILYPMATRRLAYSNTTFTPPVGWLGAPGSRKDIVLTILPMISS